MDGPPDGRLVKALSELGHVIGVETLEAAQLGANSLDPQAVITELPALSPEWAEKAASTWPHAFQVQITADAEPIQRAAALRAGADACLTKPLHVRELAGRLDAAVRRTDGASSSFHGLFLENRRLKIDGEVFNLSPLEFLILKTLSSHPGRVLTAAELGDQIAMDRLSPSPESVRAAIARLTSRISQRIGWRLVVGERGLGYRFDPRRTD